MLSLVIQTDQMHDQQVQGNHSKNKSDIPADTKLLSSRRFATGIVQPQVFEYGK